MQQLLTLPREYYVALFVIAILAWIVLRTGNPEKTIERPKPTRRDELIEARERLQRQIEILKSPMRGRPALTQENIGRLNAILEEVESELKDEKP